MRTRVTRCFAFEAAHHLPLHPGKCHRVHGHHYRLEVTLEGPLGDDGMLMDFDELACAVDEHVIADFDHRLLNDIVENPTAELVAAEAWARIESLGLPVVALRLWETPDCFVEVER